LVAFVNFVSYQKTPPPFLAISVPSLPKGGQVEWQALIHHGKVYAERAPVSKENQEGDGYETDDDDMYQVEKRALHPVTLCLGHEPPSAGAGLEAPWKTRTQSWFLSPLLTALSVVQVPEASSLASLFSSLSVSDDKEGGVEQQGLTEEMVQNMLAMMIKAMDRILQSHEQPVAGPGVKGGWTEVVGMSLYYHDNLLADQADQLASVFDELLSQYVDKSSSNVAVTLVPVQAIADRGVLALSLHAVGKAPTIPGLLQA
jgi:diphthine-ammonia ligase